MEASKINGLLVVDGDGKLVGALGMHDLLRRRRCLRMNDLPLNTRKTPTKLFGPQKSRQKNLISSRT